MEELDKVIIRVYWWAEPVIIEIEKPDIWNILKLIPAIGGIEFSVVSWLTIDKIQSYWLINSLKYLHHCKPTIKRKELKKLVVRWPCRGIKRLAEKSPMSLTLRANLTYIIKRGHKEQKRKSDNSDWEDNILNRSK